MVSLIFVRTKQQNRWKFVLLLIFPTSYKCLTYDDTILSTSIQHNEFEMFQYLLKYQSKDFSFSSPLLSPFLLLLALLSAPPIFLKWMNCHVCPCTELTMLGCLPVWMSPVPGLTATRWVKINKVFLRTSICRHISLSLQPHLMTWENTELREQ